MVPITKIGSCETDWDFRARPWCGYRGRWTKIDVVQDIVPALIELNSVSEHFFILTVRRETVRDHVLGVLDRISLSLAPAHMDLAGVIGATMIARRLLFRRLAPPAADYL